MSTQALTKSCRVKATTHLAPPIQRTVIGSPHTSVLQNNIVPMQNRAWVHVLKRRARVGKLISLLLMSILVYFNYLVLAKESVDVVSILIYSGLYGVMTWFLFSSFIKTLIGSWAIARNYVIKDHPINSMRAPKSTTRVAIIFPVYHEDVARVMAGMAATWESLAEYTPKYAHCYDLFLLSDSRKPAFIEAEKQAVLHLRTLYPNARVYYRWRPFNTHAKIGNLTDFCRRWGSVYDYMFTMDADSVVTGEVIHTTLQMMEGRSEVGILQTNPKAVFRKTIFGRMQQFSGNIFGHAFSASLQATMLGNAVYMGHNAMVRIKPFMEHCIMPSLPGDAPWGGKPLSHDIVESALMAAHGYETWFIPELVGSWEEIPANILASLIRERRWMQGNLQHGRLISGKLIPNTYREYFINGIFAYLSAPIWAIFLVVSSYTVLNFIKSGLMSPQDAALLESYMLILGISTLAVFFTIRVISVSSVWSAARSKMYGGKVSILVSVVLEFIFSVIYSPIIMMAMSRFIYLWARKKSIVWNVQDRGDNTLPWTDCFRHFGWMSMIGLVCAFFLWSYAQTIPDQDAEMMMAVSNGWINPNIILLWLTPVLTGIILSPLIVRMTSGCIPYFERCRLFMIPEEINTPQEFKTLHRVEEELRSLLPAY